MTQRLCLRSSSVPHEDTARWTIGTDRWAVETFFSGCDGTIGAVGGFTILRSELWG